MLTAKPKQQKLAGHLLLVMILASVLAGLGLSDFLWLAGPCGAAAMVLLWPRTRRIQRIQCITFIAVGLVALTWALLLGYGQIPVLQLMTQNQSLISMLCAVTFLRLITRTDTDADHIQVGGEKSFVRTLAGLHLFASVINLSALVIFADRLVQVSQLNRITTTMIQRGFALAALWSPFYAAMGTSLVYAPGTQLSDLWPVSLPLCAGGLVFTWLENRYRSNDRLAGFIGYPVSFKAIWIPTTLVVAVLGLHALLPDVSVLTLVSALALATTVAVLIYRHSLLPALTTVRSFSSTRLPDMYAELALFLSAGVMATGLGALVAQATPQLPITELSPVLAIVVLAIMLLLAISGVHALITIVAASAILLPLEPQPALLAFVFLTTWSLGATGSPISGLNLAIQSRYSIAISNCFRWNLLYTLTMFAAASLLILLVFR